MNSSCYQTLAQMSEAEFKSKGSRFIAYAYPIDNEETVKKLLIEIREVHHKARHWCYAWRLGVDGNRFRANDDGEPAGSAGRPILGQIDSAGLTNVIVIVVRYFGGTLLGVPGLIHAYKTATAEALKQASIIEEAICQEVEIECDYPQLSEALRIAERHQARVLVQDLALHCVLRFAIPLSYYDACLEAWAQTRAIQITAEK